MKLSTKSRYGLRVCQMLAENYGKIDTMPLPYIAESTSISEAYLEQIMITLKKDNIVGAVRGANGGYFLTREPKDITIGEVIRSLEDGLEFIGCINNECEDSGGCKTKNIWRKVYDGLNELLDSMTLIDLIQE